MSEAANPSPDATPRLPFDALLGALKTLPPPDNISWRVYALGGFIIRHFLGLPWIEEHVMNTTAPTAFFRNDWSTPERQETHIMRVVQLGELLFNLQHQDGFDACIRQLRNPARIESTYAELEVGRLLSLNHVAFRFVVPQGVHGSDFDLEMFFPDGRRAVADTKCKIEETTPSESTILNTLKKGRDQLPKDRPGILFVKFPQQWIGTGENKYTLGQEVTAVMTKATEDFLRNTNRIVSVKFFSMLIFPLADTHVGWFHVLHEYTNKRSEHAKAEDWSFLKEPDLSTWIQLLVLCGT